ncbi:MAG: hypothetical protein BGO41_03945 [Clostridiales bacterium 38-18]|nr:MAG: hypothetical protein BGO41_03945 [Clostridiales bacterium 38-18]
MSSIRKDLLKIASKSIEQVLPDKAVANEVSKIHVNGLPYVIAIGKAAWRMARALYDCLEGQVAAGIVITKYGHSEGDIPNFRIFEAGHPIIDEASLQATRAAITLVQSLKPTDSLFFLVSGGGSALFELPIHGITLEDLKKINIELINSGANIEEINLVRKLLSQVKGGGFLNFCGVSKIVSLVLSDVIGNALSSIASGPIYFEKIDISRIKQIILKHQINLPMEILVKQMEEASSVACNIKVETHLVGSVETMCQSAALIASQLGYNSVIREMQLQDSLEAFLDRFNNELRFFRNMANQNQKSYCLIYGGELTLKVAGAGKGGRSQHIAIKVAQLIDGIGGVYFLAQASDGTDGPTDAAGGLVDSKTAERLREKAFSLESAINDFDAYHALVQAGDLIITGPTGTNVNDLILCVITPDQILRE